MHSTKFLLLRDTHNLFCAPLTKQSHHIVHLVAVLELSNLLDPPQQMEFAYNCSYHGMEAALISSFSLCTLRTSHPCWLSSWD